MTKNNPRKAPNNEWGDDFSKNPARPNAAFCDRISWTPLKLNKERRNERWEGEACCDCDGDGDDHSDGARRPAKLSFCGSEG